MPHLHRTRHHEVVQSVTSAPESLAQDQAHRIHRYLLTMGIRTACFIGAVIAGMLGAPAWVWGSMAVLALVLPYIAVVMANAVAARPEEALPPVRPDDDPERLER
ncbi:MAG TPA: DUF3099 domain-containing protein [Pedococcus sp.]